MQATCQCGVPLQVLEDRVRELGLTTGHSPQSKPVAHMGGLVATRSIGQFSTLYGGIEDMVVGLEVVFPGGEVARIKNVPRRAAGPDIRHIVIGNEGALCFITEVTVKLFPYLPENNAFLGWTLKNMKTGFEVLREVMVSRLQARRSRGSTTRATAASTSPTSPSRTTACCSSWPRERPGSRRRRRRDRRDRRPAPGLQAVDSGLIETWFDDLVWGPEKIDAEDERIRTTRNVNRTTEISSGWSAINDIYEARDRADPRRDPRPHDPRRALVAQLHQRHQHVLQLLLRPRRLRARGRGDEVLPPDHLDHLRGDAAPRRLDRAPPRHRQGAGAVGREEYGSSFPILETLKQAFDPNGIMNRGTIIP